MVKTLSGGFTTKDGGADELVGEALGVSKGRPEQPVSEEKQSMQRQIVKLIADGKADREIMDMVGCSNGQVQIVKMYLGDIKDKVKVEKERIEVVEDKPPEEPEKEKPPEKVWDPFATGVEAKKEPTKKVKLVKAIWDPLSPDKPAHIEVPIEEEPKAEEIAEEAEEEAAPEPEKSKREQIQDLLKEGKSNSDIAKKVGVSRSYVRKINTGA